MKPEVGMKLMLNDIKAKVIHHEPDRKICEYLVLTKYDTLYWINDDFLTKYGDKFNPIQPWRDLKSGDGCKVRDGENQGWKYRVYFGMDGNGRPKTRVSKGYPIATWNYCEPLTPEDLK